MKDELEREGGRDTSDGADEAGDDEEEMMGLMKGRDERGRKGKTGERQRKGKDLATNRIREQDRRRHQ